MSDQRLRECERRFRETGSVEDEAAWLRARVRVGSLDPERLDLLAVIDYPAAILALDSAFHDFRCVPMWKRNLARFGREVSAETVLCAAGLWRGDSTDPWIVTWLNTALPLARAFLERRGPESEAGLGRVLERYLVRTGCQTWNQLENSRQVPFSSLALAIYSILHGDVTSWVNQALRETHNAHHGLEDTVREELARWVLT